MAALNDLLNKVLKVNIKTYMYTFIQNDAIVSIYAETKVSNGSIIIIISQHS